MPPRVVPGRMEVVVAGAPVAVVVDYAHTPAGLGEALRAVGRWPATGRVVCLFGCGGDRDPGKRPEMGAVATALADVVVLTSDNPRSEDPAGHHRGGAGRHVGPGRGRRRARPGGGRPGGGGPRPDPGDVVLLAGKGHEATQTTGDTVVPFDDRVEGGGRPRRAVRRPRGVAP